MAERIAISRLTRELSAIRKSCPPHVRASPSADNLLEWHFVIFDLPKDTMYHGGIYHGRLVNKAFFGCATVLTCEGPRFSDRESCD